MNLKEFQRSDKADNRHLLLFGNPVSHSLSPLMHNAAAELLGLDIRYHAVALRPDELTLVSSHLNRETFLGANVTIPYKHMLMEYVDELSIIARSVGAINTIIRTDGRLEGDNTDVYGFSVPLKPFSEELEQGRAIVFGTGGATKAIVYALKDYGMEEIILISRSPGSVTYFDDEPRVRIAGYDAWPTFADEAVLVINATPLGMEPDQDSAPIREPEKRFLENKICYDIVYNPLRTHFLRMAEEVNARTIGGLEMLVYQGSKSFELWAGKPFPADKIIDILHDKLQTDN